MPLTDSKFQSTRNVAKQFSKDGIEWQDIPSTIRVTSSRYALVFKELSETCSYLNTSSYVIAVGPSRGKLLSTYIRGRVDKACAFYKGSDEKRVVRISLTAKLVSPYVVFVR